MDGSEKGIVLFEVVLIALAVVLVDDLAVRVAMAMVPAMLLAQRALAADASTGPRVGAANRQADSRDDAQAHEGIGELLTLLREFYSTCHLFGKEQISAVEAQVRTAAVEKKLNQLLGVLTSESTEG